MEPSDTDIQKVVTRKQTSRNIPIKITDIKPPVRKPTEPDKEKIHISTFFVLFNTNIQCKDTDEDQELIADLKKAIVSCLVEDQEHVFKIVYNGTGNYDSDTIKKISVEMVGEIGPKYNRCHVHSVIRVG